MEEAERQSERYGNGSVDGKRQQTNADVSQAEPEVEANLLQLADREKAVDARIEQQDFIEDGEAGPPCGLKPA